MPCSTLRNKIYYYITLLYFNIYSYPDLESGHEMSDLEPGYQLTLSLGLNAWCERDFVVLLP